MSRYSTRTLVRMAAVVLLLAACSATAGSADHAPTAPAGGAVIVAQGLAFDRSRLEIPAGVGVPLLFENRDGAPHNVTIFDVSGTPVFTGETFGGPGSRTYALPPISAGTYTFRCDVHTDMAGALVAGAS